LLSRGRGLIRRPLPLHPIPAVSVHIIERRFHPNFLLPVFRIILYWKRFPVSGSFFDWKMLASSADHRSYYAYAELRTENGVAAITP
jgi:hypothetical protein